MNQLDPHGRGFKFCLEASSPAAQTDSLGSQSPQSRVQPELPAPCGTLCSHLCNRGTEPTRCCWPARETRTWKRAFLLGHRGCSGDSSSAAGSGGWPARPHHGAAWPSVAGRAGSCRKRREHVGEEGRNSPAHRHVWDQARETPHPGPTLPPDHVEFIQEFVDAGVVVITFCHHQVQGPAVLGANLLHQVIGHFLSLQEGKRGQSRGTAAREEQRDCQGCRIKPGSCLQTQLKQRGKRGAADRQVPEALQALPGAEALHEELSFRAGSSGNLTSGYRLLFIR